MAKGFGEETWNDLTKLCDILDKIDREADAEVEEAELDSFGTIETDPELSDMDDWQEDQAAQPYELQPMGMMALSLVNRKGKPTRNDGGSATP